MDGFGLCDVDQQDITGVQGLYQEDQLSEVKNETIDNFGAFDSLDDGFDHFNELSLGECHQRIAWSKIGCIAYISQAHGNVKLQCYPLNASIPEAVVDTVPVYGHDAQFVHVAWDPSGQTLVIIDIQSRISLYRIVSSLNDVQQVGKHIPAANTVVGVVGMHWINHRKNETRICLAAHHEQGGWRYPNIETGLEGPTHPHQDRDSVVFVKGDGSVLIMTAQYRLMHQQELYIQNTISALYTHDAHSLVSHAALTPEHSKYIFMCKFQG